MAARRERSQSALPPRQSEVEASYQSWKFQRPHLFRQSSQPPSEAMATNTAVQISVIADNQNHMVSLPNTRYDPSTRRSIISQAKANATLGCIRSCEAATISITNRPSFESQNTITLRWRHESGYQSFQETFYIVDGHSLGGLDAVLRADIEVPPQRNARPVANPTLYFGPTGRAGRADGVRRDQENERRAAAYQADVAKQREQVRRQLEASKGNGKR